jgi:hypothetical protein
MYLFNFVVPYSLHFHLQTVEIQQWMIFTEEYYAQMSVPPWDNYGTHQIWIAKESFYAYHTWVLRMFRGWPQKTKHFPTASQWYFAINFHKMTM